jgi:hypothetical protein
MNIVAIGNYYNQTITFVAEDSIPSAMTLAARSVLHIELAHTVGFAQFHLDDFSVIVHARRIAPIHRDF